MKASSALVLACMVSASALCAFGNTIVIYDSITGSNASGSQNFPASPYGSFSTGTNSGEITSLELSLQAQSPGDGGTVDVYPLPDSGANSPGGLNDEMLLGTIDDSILSSTQFEDVSVNLSSNFSLSDGTRYRITLSGTVPEQEQIQGTVRWETTINIGGTAVSSEYFSDNASGEFEMQISVGSTPEPGTVLLLTAGLASFGLVRRLR